MNVPTVDEPRPGFNFRASWDDRQIVSISSVSALRFDAGAGEEMQAGAVEFPQARSGDDAFEIWDSDRTPQAVTVTVLDAGAVPSLTFLFEDAVPISYIALDGSTLTRPRRHGNGWSCDARPSAGCPPQPSAVLRGNPSVVCDPEALIIGSAVR